MDSPGDYVPVFAAIVAVINGMTAILLARIEFRRQVFRILFVILISVLSVTAVTAMLYSQHLVITDRKAERERHQEVRDGLALLIDQGNALAHQCYDNSVLPPIAAGNEWLARSTSYLSEKMGNSYVTRFNDTTGIPSVSPDGPDEAHRNVWFNIYRRVYRLEEFSRELPPV